jgi:PAS domain S-box-containing protein
MGVHLRPLLVLLLLIRGISCLAGGTDAKPAILVIHSYHIGMPWVDGLDRGLHEALDGQAELVITQLDTKRFPAGGREAAMATTIASKASMSGARLVIAMDDYAYRFCLQNRDRIFPGLPLVFGGVNYWDGVQPPNTTGVVEAINLADTLAMIHSLQPLNRRIMVVNDQSETGRSNASALARVLAEHPTGPISYLGEGSFSDTEAVLATLSPETDSVLLLTWNLDSTGAARSYEDAIARAHAVCQAPIYGVWDFYHGSGIVGGYLLDSSVHGHEVGELARRILQGTPADRLPVVTRCRTQPAVDERELLRFGIPFSRLPPGTQVDFSHKSLLSEYSLELSLIALLVLAQGATIWVLLAGRRRRQRAEEALRQSEENLRVTLSSIADAVLATDPQGRIILMNPVAEAFTGRGASESVGRPHAAVFEFLLPDSDSPPPNPITLALEHAAPRSTLNALQLRHLSGSLRLVTIHASPLRKAGDQDGGVVAIIHDVTDTTRLEEQLRQSQKMESVGLLAGGVAHDFNNILQIIQGSVLLLDDEGSSPEDKAECLRQVRDAVKKASELTRQLLAFGRRQKLDFHLVDLSVLIENLLKMLRRVIGENIELQFKPEPARYCSMADRHQLEQVVLNLCLNARDAMPEGGRLSISLHETSFSEADASLNNNCRAGTFIQLDVQDSGTGMSREVLSRIFDPFFTTKPLGRGTGLGLSVVQGIVLQHQGFISVQSDPGHGSVFHIFLPMSRCLSKPETMEDSPPALPQGSPRRGRILYAEDDGELNQLTTRLLKRYGYEVVACADGLEALTQASDLATPFDLAMLDLMMPRMGGLEAARRIRHLRPAMPVILCSGYTEAGTETQLAAEFHHITKPYPAETLIHLIERCRNL